MSGPWKGKKNPADDRSRRIAFAFVIFSLPSSSLFSLQPSSRHSLWSRMPSCFTPFRDHVIIGKDLLGDAGLFCSGQYVLCLLHILMHLAHQRVRVGKLLLAPQPFEKGDLEMLPVQIALIIEQKDLEGDRS